MTRRIIGFIGAIAALGLIASATATRASNLLFTYSETGPDAIDATWDQSSDPTPLAYNYGVYTTVPVSNWTGNIGPYGSVTWYSLVFNNGGFSTDDAAINVYGQQFYGGVTESNPMFAPNVWAGVNAADGLSFTLTITAAPEPTAWAMMLVGIGAVGAAIRMARRRSRAAFLGEAASHIVS